MTAAGGVQSLCRWVYLLSSVPLLVLLTLDCITEAALEDRAVRRLQAMDLPAFHATSFCRQNGPAMRSQRHGAT